MSGTSGAASATTLIQIGSTQNAGECTALVNREAFDEFPGIPRSEEDSRRWREFRQAYHLAQQLEVWPPFPLQLDFELNSLCNMRCSFCVHGHQRVASTDLPWGDFTRVIDEGERNGLVSVKLNYINEPLLNKALPRFVRYARAHGILNVYFATNGTLLTEATSRDLIEAGITKIMVSLDAATPETFRAMRASEKFDQIVGNVKRFIAIRDAMRLRYPIVRVNFMRSRLNVHEQERFLEQWRGVADSIGLQSQTGLPGIDDEVLQTAVHDGEPFRCSWPFKQMVIDSKGDILPCCHFSGRLMPVGNIAEMTVQQAWLGQKMTALKHLQQRGGYAENAVCRHCIHGVS